MIVQFFQGAICCICYLTQFYLFCIRPRLRERDIMTCRSSCLKSSLDNNNGPYTRSRVQNLRALRHYKISAT
ncbi:hypothetical protein BDZ89DRAFT_179934 [Hymenopellis radicata]|nr:hypothetical protein BDZ89DRAFT_179934 [Hymenopellis radicata]